MSSLSVIPQMRLSDCLRPSVSVSFVFLKTKTKRQGDNREEDPSNFSSFLN